VRKDESYVILSPHLDDAIFSVWHVISSPAEVRVVTVFARVPERGLLTPLDRFGGAAESAERFLERLDDDREALALAEREPAYANLLDVQYRAEEVPELRAAIERDPKRFISLVAADETIQMNPSELRPELEPFLEDTHIIYCPSGIGGHPDHRDVARLGFELAMDGKRVRFYADTPYFMRRGLPSWITQVENAAADAYVANGLSLLSTSEAFKSHVVQLSPEQVKAKLVAAQRYETEFEPANADFGGVLADEAYVRYEVYWTVRGEP
jgi:LmbE family N-acetylglucosaminyl deacetylase